jgi:hypothetical protein
MKNIGENALKKRIESVLPTLNEYQRRRYLSAEANSVGYGGISIASRLSGVSRQTLTAGVKELESADAEPVKQGRSRKPGGGRKLIWETQPGILEALSRLVEARAKGDPVRLLLRTNKSFRSLEIGLLELGFTACRRVVGEMPRKLGYGLQADKKTLAVTPSRKDRGVQFEYINDEAKKAAAEGNPVISIDAKKKENIGNFKNAGQTYRPHKTPVEVLDHDFPIKELGKATPFGVYDIFKNQGFVNVGLSSDAAAFAAESVRRWRYAEGAANYGGSDKIMIAAGCGGSNGYRNRLWKRELQTLANGISRDIQATHCPPGTSKWNKIEHRLFAFITRNRQGIPLVSAAVIVNLIGNTKTEKGLSVRCVLDEDTYEKGLEVSDEQFQSINILKNDFHGEWNYTIRPNNR